MSDSCTPITQALRGRLKVAAAMLGHEPSTPLAKGVLAECDNIDAIHKALEDEYISRCKRNAKLRETLAERETSSPKDLMPLPLDADRAPICVGDHMQSVVKPDSRGTVYRMELTRDGWWIHFGSVGMRPEKCRHCHKPTVADVLREFADGIKDQNADFTELAIAEYAKRLKLAEGDAE